MEAFEFCIDSLRGIVPGVLNSGKNNLTAAKSSIELANSCTVEGVDTSGLTNAIAWIDRTIGFVNQWGGWIQEKISALEKLDSDNNQLASLLGEDVDINNIDLDKIIEQAEKMLGLIGNDIDLQEYLEQIKNGSIGSSKTDKEWATSSIFELLEEKYDKFVLDLTGGRNAEAYAEKYGNFLEVPRFNQMDYPDVTYGRNNVAKGGCGLNSFCQVLTSLGVFQSVAKDKDGNQITIGIDPKSLAEYYKGSKENGGTPTRIMNQMLKDANVTYEELNKKEAWDVKWPQGKGVNYKNSDYTDNRIVQEVKNGNKVILLVAGPEFGGPPNAFTTGGHYIAITGITDDNKFIIYDPNGNNWNQGENTVAGKGFREGFDLKEISNCAQDYFVINTEATKEAHKGGITNAMESVSNDNQFLEQNND